MINLLFFLTIVVYSFYAYLPFINLSSKYHYLFGAICAVLGSFLWVSISRNLEKDKLVIYGAYFDMLLTLCFLIVPTIVGGSTITNKQILGIVIMLLGMVLTKF